MNKIFSQSGSFFGTLFMSFSLSTSDGVDIRLFNYPNRIRLFLGLPSPTFRGQIHIRPFSYMTFSECRVNFKQIARYLRKIFNFLGIQIWLFEILNYPNLTLWYSYLTFWYPLHHFCILNAKSSQPRWMVWFFHGEPWFEIITI